MAELTPSELARLLASRPRTRVKLTERKCAHCGKVFQAKTSLAIYCSRKCANVAAYLRRRKDQS